MFIFHYLPSSLENKVGLLSLVMRVPESFSGRIVKTLFLFQMVSLWTIASASVEQDAVATLSTQDPQGFLVLNRQEPN